MKKMKLSLEDLAVETFDPNERLAPRGTVGAHQSGWATDECASCGVHSCAVACSVGSCTEYGVWTCEPNATCVDLTCLPPHCTEPGAGC